MDSFLDDDDGGMRSKYDSERKADMILSHAPVETHGRTSLDSLLED